MPLFQPSLYPEPAFAVVRASNPGHRNAYRPECEPCQWIGPDRSSYASAEFVVRVHNAVYHAN